MTQNWIHTNLTPDTATAIDNMRFSVSLSASLCGYNFEKSDYQPRLGGKDRQEKEF